MGKSIVKFEGNSDEINTVLQMLGRKDKELFCQRLKDSANRNEQKRYMNRLVRKMQTNR